MDWIFDNLQILFVVAAGVAYWINSMRQAKEEAENERNQPPVDLEEVFGPDFDFDAPPPRGEEPQQTEVFLPPPVAASPPPIPSQAPKSSQRERRDFPQASPSPQRPKSPHQPGGQEAVNAELERQRHLEERIRALRQKRDSRSSGAAATQRSVVAKRAAKQGGVPDVEPIALDGIRSRLRSSREARRAVVLREILDKPVGMR